MRRRFHKMHGLGNDFVVIDTREDPFAVTPGLARAIADRHRGIGCDQLILIEPSDIADIRMRILNADGGEAGACGNAARCVAALIGGRLSIETAGGRIAGDAGASGVRIDMGTPRFGWEDVPLAYPLDTAGLPLAWPGASTIAPPVALNVGNPHVVLFVADPDDVDLGSVGPIIEHDPIFPERINVGVAAIEDRRRLRLKVWERGAGATQACGTGACAAAVAAIRSGLAATPVSVSLPGGVLEIDWAPDGTITMAGPAAHVFEGFVDPEALAR